MDEGETEARGRIAVLPDGMSGADFAGAAREAALAFVNGAARWTKSELSAWLAGPYASLTRHAHTEEATPTWPVPSLQDVDHRLVRRMLDTARAEVLDALCRIVKDGAGPFVLRMLIAGFIARCRDGNGEPSWAPTGAAVRLADRVMSLFAVDYLARPEDYEVALGICSLCSEVLFDKVVRRRGVCDQHVESSLLAVRGKATTSPPPCA
jgi:hypothetical protein